MGTPLVELQVNKEWCKVSDAAVRFTVASTYQRSSWDWIAIYKVILELVFCTKPLNNFLQFDAPVSVFKCHLLLLHRLGSDITKITRHTYGPRESMRHRCVRYWNSHIYFCTSAESRVNFLPFLSPPGDIFRGGFAKRWLWIHAGLLQ